MTQIGLDVILLSWLRDDTFTWYSGDSQDANSYEKVYQHLVDDIDGKTLQSETIQGITIQYYLADDTHRICPATEEQNLIDLYNLVGSANYYLLDTENIRFKLPRKKNLNIIRSYKNDATYYNLYANGWVEQGGNAITNSSTPKQVLLPITMADVYYKINYVDTVGKNTAAIKKYIQNQLNLAGYACFNINKSKINNKFLCTIKYNRI